MSGKNGNIEQLSPTAKLKPLITLIVAPLGFLIEFIIEAPFIVLLFLDRLFKKKLKR